MSKKLKDHKVTVKLPDERHLKHVVDAYGLVCMYRTASKKPVESMETWLGRLIIEGCNAMYRFDREQQLAAQKAAEEKAKAKEADADKKVEAEAIAADAE